MRVALTVTRSDVFGGAVVHVRDVCLGLHRLGHDVEVFIGGNGSFSDHLRQHGVPVRCVPHLGRAIRPFRDLLALRELVTGLASFDPDIIHAHTGKAGWLTRVAAALLHKPFIYSPHCWPFLDDQAAPRRLVYLLAERLIARLPGTTVNVCAFERHVALAARVGRSSQHVVVHNGVADVDECHRARPGADPPHIVMVARFEPQKDYATVVVALARLKTLDWQATFIGDGPQRSKVREQLRALGLEHRVAFPGEVEHVEQWLAGAQLYVLMSNWEGLPLTVLEAMRGGLPVVASRTGGVAEAVVHDESGLLVARGDVDGLERSLQRLLEDPAARERMGQAGRRVYVEKFTIERMIAALEGLYHSVAVVGPRVEGDPLGSDGSLPRARHRARAAETAAPAPLSRATTTVDAARDGLRNARRYARIATSGMRALPDFLVIGTQRGGTTSLYRYVAEHPLVRPAQSKEIHYFDTYFELGGGWYRSHFPLSSPSSRRPLTGEATPYYLFHPHAPERVAAMLPDVKIIALLRDPVQRAYSHYHHEREKGWEPLTFEQAVGCESERLHGELERMTQDPTYDSHRLRHYSYLARGRYAEQLARWFVGFPRAQLLLLKSEDLYHDPAATVAEVDRFLGLPPRPSRIYPPHNARSYDSLELRMADELRQLFAPHNNRLYELVGRDFGWDAQA